MSELIKKSEQLPVAWLSPNIINGVLDIRPFKLEGFTPLYTHPMRKLTRKDFLEIWENEVNKFYDVEEYDIANFARAIIKASRGEK
jgi:hypothetical protein